VCLKSAHNIVSKILRGLKMLTIFRGQDYHRIGIWKVYERSMAMSENP
jgi:hypothetical protein